MKLTVEQVEEWRAHLSRLYAGEFSNMAQIETLCDMALASLSRPAEDADGLVAELDALEAKATPGPWSAWGKESTGYGGINEALTGQYKKQVHDAALCAALRNAYPKLRALLAAQRENDARWRCLLDNVTFYDTEYGNLRDSKTGATVSVRRFYHDVCGSKPATLQEAIDALRGQGGEKV